MGRGVPHFAFAKRRTTMLINTTTHAVCRLLGGSGLAPLVAVQTKKLPALLEPISRQPADTVVQSSSLPLAA